jgi:glycosyltransferase involved in cell wall biosynthesis
MDVDRERVSRYGRALARWTRLVTSGKARPGVRVFYGHDRVPLPGERAAGGSVKMQKLAERFPNSPSDFSVLYLGTTWLPRDLGPVLRVAKRRGAGVIVNQDGVGYPGWAGDRAEDVNRPLRRTLQAADHVIYQSEFSKLSADLFLGEPPGTWEILPNAVDVSRFAPAATSPPGGPVILLGGDQTQRYRLELALRTFALLRSRHPEARLLVTGRLVSSPEALLVEHGLGEHVAFLGEYAQSEAPEILQRAHVLLHTKVKDPCPTLVIEAMAAGLPVVYPASGGTVELVGDEAGVGVEHPDSWERDDPPQPAALADAVELVLADLPRYSKAARMRAVERYSLEPWLERHAELFARFAPK